MAKKPAIATLRLELGDRVCRDIVLENTGTRARRSWWILSSVVVARVDRPAA
jgi:hypothetical protein